MQPSKQRIKASQLALTETEEMALAAMKSAAKVFTHLGVECPEEQSIVTLAAAIMRHEDSVALMNWSPAKP